MGSALLSGCAKDQESQWHHILCKHEATPAIFAEHGIVWQITCAMLFYSSMHKDKNNRENILIPLSSMAYSNTVLSVYNTIQ